MDSGLVIKNRIKIDGLIWLMIISIELICCIVVFNGNNTSKIAGRNEYIELLIAALTYIYAFWVVFSMNKPDYQMFFYSIPIKKGTLFLDEMFSVWIFATISISSYSLCSIFIGNIEVNFWFAINMFCLYSYVIVMISFIFFLSSTIKKGKPLVIIWGTTNLLLSMCVCIFNEIFSFVSIQKVDSYMLYDYCYKGYDYLGMLNHYSDGIIDNLRYMLLGESNIWTNNVKLSSTSSILIVVLLIIPLLYIFCSVGKNNYSKCHAMCEKTMPSHCFNKCLVLAYILLCVILIASHNVFYMYNYRYGYESHLARYVFSTNTVIISLIVGILIIAIIGCVIIKNGNYEDGWEE